MVDLKDMRAWARGCFPNTRFKMEALIGEVDRLRGRIIELRKERNDLSLGRGYVPGGGELRNRQDEHEAMIQEILKELLDLIEKIIDKIPDKP